MQISDEVIKVLEYLCDKIGITIDWTSNNVLPYLEQLCEKFIKWEIATSIAWLILGVVFAIIGCLFIKLAKKIWGEYKKEYEEGYFALSAALWAIFGILVLISFAVVGTQVFDIIECYTFPEKTIYDYIQYNYGNV